MRSMVKWIGKAFQSQLRVNMLTGAGATAFGGVVALLSYPIYLHYLGYSRYGTWLVLATVLNLAQFGNLGLLHAIAKLVAEDFAHRDLASIERTLANSLAAVTVSGTAILGCVIFFRTQIIFAFNLTDADALLVKSLLPYIGLLSLYALLVESFSATLVGLGRIDLYNYMLIATQSVSLGVSALMLACGWGIESLLIGTAASYALKNIWATVGIRHIVPLRLRFSSLSWASLRRLLGFGGWVLAEILMLVPLSSITRLILSRYSGVSAIPVFEIAYNAAFKMRSLLEAALRALMPEISRVSVRLTQSACDRVLFLNRRAWNMILLGGLPLFVALFAFARPLLHTWLRAQFNESLPPTFRIMLIGSFLSLACMPSYYILMGLGAVKHTFVSGLLQAIVIVLFFVGAIALGVRINPQIAAFAVSLGIAATSAYCVWRNPCHHRKWLTAMDPELLTNSGLNSVVPAGSGVSRINV